MKNLMAMLIGCFLVSGCASPSLKKQSEALTPKLASFTLLHQSNRQGSLGPCGCHYNPIGGIDREYNALKAIRALNRPSLFVDAGNLFALPNTKIKTSLLQKKAQVIRDLLNVSGLKILAPGPDDYALGFEFLQDLSKGARFSWVSSNVFSLATHQTAFKPFHIEQVGDLKIAVLSMSSPKELKVTGLEIREPKQVIQAWTEKLRPQSDLIIVLSQLPFKDMEAILNDLDVDIIVSADKKVMSENAFSMRNHKTLVLENSNHGYRLGQLNLELYLPQQGFYSLTELKGFDEQIAFYEKRLKNKKLAQNKADRLELAKLYEEKKNYAILGRTAYEHDLIRLDPERFGSPNEVSKMVDAYRAELKKAALSE